jgi:hypothetical protein
MGPSLVRCALDDQLLSAGRSRASRDAHNNARTSPATSAAHVTPPTNNTSAAKAAATTVAKRHAMSDL